MYSTLDPVMGLFQSAPASLRRENPINFTGSSSSPAFQSAPASLRRENSCEFFHCLPLECFNPLPPF